mmetsp:Transcript_114874/g.305414  ORF Transcript_114874/g.305414 Transcript_114874/m.305414 type:complete len:250 (-) Transcript_114874:342-1091(-)
MPPPPLTKKSLTALPDESVMISALSYSSFDFSPSCCTRSLMCLSTSFSQPLACCTVRLVSAPSSLSTRRPSLTARDSTTSSVVASEGSILRLSGRSLKTSNSSTSLASVSCSSSTPPSGTSSPDCTNFADCSTTTGRTFFFWSLHLRSKGDLSLAMSHVRFCRLTDHCSRNSMGGFVSRKSVQAVQRIRAPSLCPSSQNTSTHLPKVGKAESSNCGLEETFPTQLRSTVILPSPAEQPHVTAQPYFSST